MSKQTPLPTSVTFGIAGSPQLKSIRRGARAVGRAADRVDEREVLLQQVVADDHADFAPWRLAERAGGGFELGRAHVVGRRVDQVARKRDALGDAGEIAAVDARGARAAPPCPAALR